MKILTEKYSWNAPVRAHHHIFHVFLNLLLNTAQYIIDVYIYAFYVGLLRFALIVNYQLSIVNCLNDFYRIMFFCVERANLTKNTLPATVESSDLIENKLTAMLEASNLIKNKLTATLESSNRIKNKLTTMLESSNRIKNTFSANK